MAQRCARRRRRHHRRPPHRRRPRRHEHALLAAGARGVGPAHLVDRQAAVARPDQSRHWHRVAQLRARGEVLPRGRADGRHPCGALLPQRLEPRRRRLRPRVGRPLARRAGKPDHRLLGRPLSCGRPRTGPPARAAVGRCVARRDRVPVAPRPRRRVRLAGAVGHVRARVLRHLCQVPRRRGHRAHRALRRPHPRVGRRAHHAGHRDAR